MKHNLFFAISATLCLTSCKEKIEAPEPEPTVNTEMQNGLPPDRDLLNGYLYGCYFGSQGKGSVLAFASFRDPSSDLLPGYDHGREFEVFSQDQSTRGNVRVGDVSVLGLTLIQSFNGSNVTYKLNSSNNVNNPAGTVPHWVSAGNLSFVPLNQPVNRGFPGFYYSSTSNTVSTSQGWVIDPEIIASNADSLVIYFGSYNQTVIRKASAGEPIRYSSSELATLKSIYGTNPNVTFCLFNYSHITLNSKLYVFELGNKFTKTIYFTP